MVCWEAWVSKESTLVGLEPTRDKPNRFLVDRLNHSAKVSNGVKLHSNKRRCCTRRAALSHYFSACAGRAYILTNTPGHNRKPNQIGTLSFLPYILPNPKQNATHACTHQKELYSQLLSKHTLSLSIAEIYIDFKSLFPHHLPSFWLRICFS